MKIIVAPDSFKGTMTSREAADYLSRRILSMYPDAETVAIPIGDGGEGTVDALCAALDGRRRVRRVSVSTVDPLRRGITAEYAVVEGEGDKPVALIESAAASGLSLVLPEERNIMKADTYGTGLLMADAINRGIREIMVCMGGTATCDGGFGALEALSGLDMANVSVTCLCDVRSPLCGPEGAAAVFGPQKGASPDEIPLLDKRLKSLAESYRSYRGTEISDLPYAGAAGGLAGMLIACCGAKAVSGIEKVLQTINFDEYLKEADLVVTGEGRADASTLAGKAAKGILDAVRNFNKLHHREIPVVLMPGCFNEYDVPLLEKAGFKIIRHGKDSIVSN